MNRYGWADRWMDGKKCRNRWKIDRCRNEWKDGELK